jgi:predicted RNA binding protein YcfA (HicA-like mRNA interferase family)
MKSREFCRVVAEAGGVLERKDGDHYIYRLPNGRTLIVPVGGGHTEIAPYLPSKLRRLLREPKREAVAPS